MSRKMNLAVALLAMLPVMATRASAQTQSPVKKLLTLALTFVTLALIGTEVMAQTRIINLNTGYDQWTKAKIEVGQQDNEWRVISDTINGAPRPPPATANRPMWFPMTAGMQTLFWPSIFRIADGSRLNPTRVSRCPFRFRRASFNMLTISLCLKGFPLQCSR